MDLILTQKKSLPELCCLPSSPFHNLYQVKILKRCLRSKTQNTKQTTNQCIWNTLPKPEFVVLTTLQLGEADTVTSFNEGTRDKINVM